MKDHIKKIIDSSYEIASRWSDFAVLWRLSGLPVKTKFSRLYDETFEKYCFINMQMIEGFYDPEVVQSLDNPKLLPKIAEVNNYLSTASKCINNLLSEFNIYQDANFREVESNLESIQGFVNGDHVITINIGDHLDLFNESLFKAHHVGVWWCVAD
jgi:phage anti-repressor protein